MPTARVLADTSSEACASHMISGLTSCSSGGVLKDESPELLLGTWSLSSPLVWCSRALASSSRSASAASVAARSMSLARQQYVLCSRRYEMEVGLSTARRASAVSAARDSLVMRAAIECSSDSEGECSSSLPKKADCATPKCLAALCASAMCLSKAMRASSDSCPADVSRCLRARYAANSTSSSGLSRSAWIRRLSCALVLPE